MSTVKFSWELIGFGDDEVDLETLGCDQLTVDGVKEYGMESARLAVFEQGLYSVRVRPDVDRPELERLLAEEVARREAEEEEDQ